MSAIEVANNLYLLVAALGLCISVQYAGLPILGQSAFVAIGGVGTFQLAQHGLPLLLAVGLSVLMAGVGGFLLGLGAGRLHGAPLALGTWALAWLVQSMLVAFPNISGGSQGLVREAPAHLVSRWLGVSWTLTTTTHVVVAAMLCLVTLLALHRLDHGPAGLDLTAMRAGPALAASLGVRVAARRRQALAATAALGALGGAGSALLLGTVAPADVGPLLSVQLLVAVLLAAAFRPYGVVFGFAVVAALPHAADAIASAADLSPERVRGAVTAALLVVALLIRGLLRSRGASSLRSPAGMVDEELPPAGEPADEVLLVAERIGVSFGAVKALDDVGLELRAGEVHALVGPNGSGKSTLLRVLAGALRPGSGSVTSKARVARTPQQTVLLEGLTPLAQTTVGAQAVHRMPLAGLRHLLVTPSSGPYARELRLIAQRALQSVGLTARSGATLDAGEQRLLQVARVAATGAQVILLDEPAAGTTPAERVRLASAIRRYAGNGSAVCLVEHDMNFVGQVADRITVLDAGRVLTTGDPAMVRQDARVRRAYLGDEGVVA